MARATVLWTEPRQDAPDVIDTLEAAGCEVQLGHPQEKRDRPMSQEQLVAHADGLHAIMVGGRERVDRAFLEAATELVVVSKRGIGVDRIDVDAATALGIMVINTPVDLHRTAVAEYGVALLFALAKRVPHADRTLRAGGFDLLRSTLLNGKTVGIIGYGNVGRAAARLLAGLGMEVLSYDPVATPDATSVPLDELLARADAITVHAALTEDNHHLVDAELLARTKRGVLFVNTARGGLVDEAALSDAIRTGQVGGAALNVFAQEPPPPDSPILAADIADRVVVTPHGAGQGVQEVHDRMPRAQASYVLTALRGNEPRSEVVSPVVNPEVMDGWRGHTRAPLAGE